MNEIYFMHVALVDLNSLEEFEIKSLSRQVNVINALSVVLSKLAKEIKSDLHYTPSLFDSNYEETIEEAVEMNLAGSIFSPTADIVNITDQFFEFLMYLKNSSYRAPKPLDAYMYHFVERDYRKLIKAIRRDLASS